MVVLVGAGVLGLPWLFETQPRPMSPDVRIVQAGAHAGAEAETPSRVTSGRVAQVQPPPARVVNITPPTNTPDTQAVSSEPSSQARAGSASDVRAKELAQPAGAVPRLATVEPARQPDKVPAKPAKPADKAAAKAPEKAAEKPAKPVAKPADKTADKKPEPKAADTRYVVQFGAFADVNAAREARQKAERMGLKTYAQQVDTPQGKRIRVRLGPFADKAEADKALATLRKGGLNGNVLTL